MPKGLFLSNYYSVVFQKAPSRLHGTSSVHTPMGWKPEWLSWQLRLRSVWYDAQNHACWDSATAVGSGFCVVFASFLEGEVRED